MEATQVDLSLFVYGAPVHLSLIEALAQVAREARQEAGLKQSRIAAALDADQSTVTRFEKGNWPRNPQRMLEAYAEELGVPAPVLAKRAIKLWEADGNSNNSR